MRSFFHRFGGKKRERMFKSVVDRIYIGEISSFAISFCARNYTCRTTGSLVVKALLQNNFQTLGATFHESCGRGAGTCLNPIFYCSWCSFLAS